MLITKKELSKIEQIIKHDCIVGVRFHRIGLCILVEAKNPKNGEVICFEKIFNETEMNHFSFNAELPLDDFANRVKEAFALKLN